MRYSFFSTVKHPLKAKLVDTTPKVIAQKHVLQFHSKVFRHFGNFSELLNLTLPKACDVQDLRIAE
jgi:hypothetical protein